MPAPHPAGLSIFLSLGHTSQIEEGEQPGNKDNLMSALFIDRWIETSTTKVSQAISRAMPRIQESFGGSVLLTPDDLEVLDNGLIYEEGNNERLKIMWFKVLEREGGQAYPLFRVVRLMQLRLIPMDVRADPGVLARMRSVLRGLYGAEVELVYLVAGMFHPRRLGIVQLYGVVGRGSSLEDAEQLALNSAAALEASMSAAYPQIRLGDVDMDMARWLDDALKHMPHCLLAVGHPDPRERSRRAVRDLPNPFIGPAWSGSVHLAAERAGDPRHEPIGRRFLIAGAAFAGFHALCQSHVSRAGRIHLHLGSLAEWSPLLQFRPVYPAAAVRLAGAQCWHGLHSIPGGKRLRWRFQRRECLPH